MNGFVLDAEGQERLIEYFEQIGRVLGSDARMASYASYAIGLIGDGDRKSMEPIAARVCPNEDETNAAYQRIQHFITDSRWSDAGVRKEAANYGLDAMVAKAAVTHWIIDDTGFIKSGKHSAGVKRQYTGSAGKVTNCQVAVSLTVASESDHLPMDFELYLPREWLDDAERREEARIPDDIQFRTKLELAIEMIDRAIENEVPPGIVSADAAYGNSSRFRRRIRDRGLPYTVAVNATTKIWQLDSLERRMGGRTLTVAEYADLIIERGGFRRTTWREGTNGKLSARFAARRVLPIADEGVKRAEREVVWLLMEWRDSERKPHKFYFITAPKSVTKKKLVRLAKQQWRTEHAYQTLKGQLGLDHFEGRRYPGWHHHISVVLSCYAFIFAERARCFPLRTEKRIETSRTSSRPERHFADSFITVRRAIAKVIASWLPRCPCCQRDNSPLLDGYVKYSRTRSPPAVAHLA